LDIRYEWIVLRFKTDSSDYFTQILTGHYHGAVETARGMNEHRRKFLDVFEKQPPSTKLTDCLEQASDEISRRFKT
jgi:hypothetical protein